MGKEQTFKRKEIKYLLSESQYRSLLPELVKYAEVDNYGKTRINNIYFDTESFQLIRTSLDKPVYKEKLRLRTYGNTEDESAAFIEIKKKYKGVVYKRRVASTYDKAIQYLLGQRRLEDEEKSQVTDEIDEFLRHYEGIKPAMVIGYDRIAMAGTINKEFRVTFDTNITWRVSNLDLKHGSYGVEIIHPNEYLMEIKIPDAFPLELSLKLSELEIYPTSFSKYGNGYIDFLREASVQNTFDKRYANICYLFNNQKGEMAYA